MNSQQNKLVSIGLPVYNGARTLRRAVDSLLSQTYINFELIISDDASNDETSKICKEYAAKDSRIRYIRQKENTGQLINFPFVLKEAKGEYFMWASIGGWWDKLFIEKLINVLENNKKYDVAMSSYYSVRDNGEKNKILLSGEYDLTEQNYYSVYKKMMLGAPIHLYLYGLFRREFLNKFFQRPSPSCIHWDRVLMCEVALAAHFYSVEPELYFKYWNRIPVRMRYTDNLSKSYRKPFAFSRYILAMLLRPLTSSAIPLKQKLVIPFPWLILIWRQRKKIFWDFVRVLRRLLKK